MSVPSVGQINGFVGAWLKHAVNGFKVVTDEVLAARLAACAACPYLNDKRCALCGCPVDKKARWVTSDCPDKPSRWSLL